MKRIELAMPSFLSPFPRQFPFISAAAASNEACTQTDAGGPLFGPGWPLALHEQRGREETSLPNLHLTAFHVHARQVH